MAAGAIVEWTAKEHRGLDRIRPAPPKRWQDLGRMPQLGRHVVVELMTHAPLSQHGRHEPAGQASGAIGQRRVLDACAEKLMRKADRADDRLRPLPLASQAVLPVEVTSTDSTAAATSHNHKGRQAPWRNRCTHRCRNWSSGPTMRT